MGSNGQRRPARPRIELSGADAAGREGAGSARTGAIASQEEAAAIAAAIEQFLRDTAPPPAAPGPALNPWLRAGLLDATGRGSAGLAPWGRSAPWS